MFGGSFNSKQCPIGIDVGMHGVKLMQLGRSGDGYKVIAAAEADLPEGTALGGEGYHRAVAEAIANALDAGKFSGKQVVSCLPADAVQYKNLRLPKMPAKDLASAVKWEANDRLQLTDKPHTVEFFDAGEVRQGDEERHEVILLAAATPFIEDHVKSLTDCGLTPEAVDVVPGALARVMTTSGEESTEDAARVVIDMGFSSTKVLILRGDKIVFFKLIDIGGKNLDDAAARHLKMPRAEVTALRMGMRQEDAETPAHVQRAIHESVRPALTDIGREIGLCLRYYSVTFRGRRPESAALVGGEGAQPWLEEMLTEQTGIAVKTADPLDGFDRSAVVSVIPDSAAPAWAVAAGLSLRTPETARSAKEAA